MVIKENKKGRQESFLLFQEQLNENLAPNSYKDIHFHFHFHLEIVS